MKITSLPTPAASPFLDCAVPRDQQGLKIAQLPDEYQKNALFTSDNFYKINLADGSLFTIFDDPSIAIDATNMKVVNKTLFFVNRFDSKLYSLNFSN